MHGAKRTAELQVKFHITLFAFCFNEMQKVFHAFTTVTDNHDEAQLPILNKNSDQSRKAYKEFFKALLMLLQKSKNAERFIQ